MVEKSTLTRRETLKSSMLLAFIPGLTIAAAAVGAQVPSNAKALVSYFTRTGNTRVIAGQISRALGTDLFEIEPAEPYPEDYEAC